MSNEDKIRHDILHEDIIPDQLAERYGWRFGRLHQSVLDFLKDNPELYEAPLGSLEPGWTYPSLDGWIDFSQILTEGKFWGNEAMMVTVAKHCLGRIVAIIFPKFYLCEWEGGEE